MLKKSEISGLAWGKMHGLLPAVVQNIQTGDVLMLGYMNQEALQATLDTEIVTFFSRSKNRLWVKGETSGNRLKLARVIPDCDQDTLLILAMPEGPTCHTGEITCFGHPSVIGLQNTNSDLNFLHQLEQTIMQRGQESPEESYTASLLTEGLIKVAQKVGEEAVETILAAIGQEKKAFINEVADLLYHLLVLLRAKKIDLVEIIQCLRDRSA